MKLSRGRIRAQRRSGIRAQVALRSAEWRRDFEAPAPRVSTRTLDIGGIAALYRSPTAWQSHRMRPTTVHRLAGDARVAVRDRASQAPHASRGDCACEWRASSEREPLAGSSVRESQHRPTRAFASRRQSRRRRRCGRRVRRSVNLDMPRRKLEPSEHGASRRHRCGLVVPPESRESMD